MYNPYPKPEKAPKKKPKGLARSQKPLPRATKRPKPRSKTLIDKNKIYQILQPIKLRNDPDCELRLPGCRGVATEVHHAAGRDGWKLIIYEWFRSACPHCHHIAGVDSRAAIAGGQSMSRLSAEVTVRWRWVSENVGEYLEQFGIKI